MSCNCSFNILRKLVAGTQMIAKCRSIMVEGLWISYSSVNPSHVSDDCVNQTFFESEQLISSILEWQKPTIHLLFLCKVSYEKIIFSSWICYHHVTWRHRNNELFKKHPSIQNLFLPTSSELCKVLERCKKFPLGHKIFSKSKEHKIM